MGEPRFAGSPWQKPPRPPKPGRRCLLLTPSSGSGRRCLPPAWRNGTAARQVGKRSPTPATPTLAQVRQHCGKNGDSVKISPLFRKSFHYKIRFVSLSGNCNPSRCRSICSGLSGLGTVLQCPIIMVLPALFNIDPPQVHAYK